jgi:hypothetical protein
MSASAYRLKSLCHRDDTVWRYLIEMTQVQNLNYEMPLVNWRNGCRINVKKRNQ